MEITYLFYLFFFISSYVKGTTWNNLNCPAPRAPDNGLSFIFRNGELVHFRCHPGYVMKGKPVAYCVNNVWTEPAPECVPIQKWPLQSSTGSKPEYEDDFHHRNRNQKQQQEASKLDKQRKLFNWGDNGERSSEQGAYGDGPRRLPLINGIWPPQDHVEQVLALGPQSTPGPKTMVKEEIDIAELRHKQLEELKKQRYTESVFDGKKKPRRKNKHKKKNAVVIDESVPRETVLSLGNTEEGEALSIAFSKINNGTENVQVRHKHRHRGGRRKKHHGGRKLKSGRPTPQTNFIISRASRVDTSGIAPYHTRYQFTPPKYDVLEELRRRPVERVHQDQHNPEIQSLGTYDTSCVESLYGREVPMIAPQVPNAFVYRYETKKNKFYPFNNYMQVKYRCLSGYSFANLKAQTLHCKEASWVGEVPRCVRSMPIN